MKSKRIVIYNPKRFFLFTTILILIFSIIIANIFNLNKSYGQYANKEFDYDYYVVKKGDTLWSISQKFPGVSVIVGGHPRSI